MNQIIITKLNSIEKEKSIKLMYACETGSRASNRQKSICIGTANSSVRQLYLYQKLGFEITDIKRHFFIDNYAEPIYEDGIQAKHMLVLTRQLNDERQNQQDKCANR